MSIYKDLNHADMDVNQYEEQELTSIDKKNWERRVLKKIRKQKPSRKKKYAGAAAAVILAAGISLSTGMVSFANVPFVGGLVEGFILADEKTDYTPYKTEIGSTAENKFGKWTLNEVMADSGQLIISSTFEPAKGVDFHYRMHPRPNVQMNGQELTGGGLQQSIKVNSSQFTIYNKIQMTDMPIGETVRFHLEFDNLDSTIDSEGVPVDTPWVFDIEVPTDQLAASSETVVLNKDVPVGNGQTVHLEKMIVTPISTVLYYDWPEEANHIGFKIVSESGTEVLLETSTISPEESYSRYAPIDLESEKYFLVPYESSENPHAENPGEVPEQSIPVNPLGSGVR
ncbi:DUF4179 domain-containing protein [Paenibacillus spongiae]|uniref:DUF4179 domain-containing protein n=1 Tax=Paenibacillus spongiae TaxID=2909671 RepID=A0ABY5SAA9_9BACL|nr:DUF4179 domain-containing protein [Paenibacillus spongiae]UVI29757.1 DUF4179 domain-containing protein [Paenibacillus spongiae]